MFCESVRCRTNLALFSTSQKMLGDKHGEVGGGRELVQVNVKYVCLSTRSWS